MTQPVKNSFSSQQEQARELSTAINQILLGRINTVRTLTIVSGTTTTVVTDPNAHTKSVPFLIPLASSTLTPYVSARTLGSFTLTHAAPGANIDYAYVLLG